MGACCEKVAKYSFKREKVAKYSYKREKSTVEKSVLETESALQLSSTVPIKCQFVSISIFDLAHSFLRDVKIYFFF